MIASHDASALPSMRIGFILCCYNSRDRLPETLAHLARQCGAERAILVDNASADGTADYALSQWAQLGAPFEMQVVHEPSAGLCHARRRGLDAAKQAELDVIVFVDDDNWLFGEWLPIVSRIFGSQPSVAAIGGFGSAVFEDGIEPPWFAAIQEGFACGPQGEQGLVPLSRGYLSGAGLAIRMEAWTAIAGDFVPHLTGRSGNQVLAGDDTELCLALQRAGWRLWYASELRYGHFMPKVRMNAPYAERMYAGFGLSSRIIYHQRMLLCGRQIAAWFSSSRTMYRLGCRIIWRLQQWRWKRPPEGFPDTLRAYRSARCQAI